MLTPKEIEALRLYLGRVLDPVYEFLIEDICRRIAKAGTFTNTALYQRYLAETLGRHWDEVRVELSERLAQSEQSIQDLYEQAAERAYTNSASRLADSFIPFDENAGLQQIIRANKALATEDFQNLTQTIGMVDRNGTPLPLRDFYRQSMDYVFKNVQSGAIDYNRAVRIATRRLADKGIVSIGYESGVVTSLEAAVRRNVMGGLGLMVEQVEKQNHDTLGADGWEISAHSNSAPDHEPIQGKQYPDAEYTALNNSLQRRIGTLNCGHIAFPIILGVNQPVYTPEQLEEMKRANAEGVTIGGRHFTGYEATQQQRQFERQIRGLRKQALVAESTGDEARLHQLNTRIALKQQDYRRFSKQAGLITQDERLHTAGWGRSQGARVGAETRRINSFQKLAGITAADGREIRSVAYHIGTRSVERTVAPSAARDALETPLHVSNVKVDSQGRSSVQYIGNHATVVVNPETGNLVSCWPTGEQRRKKYGGNAND